MATEAAQKSPTIDPLKTTMGYSLAAGADGFSATAFAGNSGVRPPTGPIDFADGFDATMAAPSGGVASPMSTPSVRFGTSSGRTTVLPRRTKQGDTAPLSVSQPRFDRVKLLGQGGMGEVALVRDNDIRRTVAVKYVRPEVANADGVLLRFADEIRVVGQLEHPSIVPVYDVGVDDSGQHFLVMKHLHGETMEQILDKLRAGDGDTLARFSLDHRVHLFLQVLDAMRYAHSRGIIHRDLKPANIMIGPYGEVTVVDWGIAKPFTIDPKSARPSDRPVDKVVLDSHPGRLLETQLGALAGTPMYMSPEQAAGRNDDLDARSDVYALGVVLFEWLTFEHPLQGKKSLIEVLGAITGQEHDPATLRNIGIKSNTPMEYITLIRHAVARDREARLPSVAVFEERLENIVAGRIPITCHVTLAKRIAATAGHWIDRHQLLYTMVFFSTFAIATLSAVGFGVRAIVQAMH